jgi:type I restriction enzyme R subunit
MLVIDADVLAELIASKDPKKAKEVEIKIVAQLRKHKDDPKFIALGHGLEELKERHEFALLTSLEFLKQLLEIAKEVVNAEKEVVPQEEQDRGKAVLTELFNEVRSHKTPIVVERLVNDIDEVVRIVRFPGWQQTVAGEREVQKPYGRRC